MNRLPLVAALIIGLAPIGSIAAHAQTPEHKTELAAEKDCIAQYKYQHDEHKTSLPELDFVKQCMAKTATFKDRAATESDCVRMFKGAQATHKTTLDQAAYVQQCMTSH